MHPNGELIGALLKEVGSGRLWQGFVGSSFLGLLVLNGYKGLGFVGLGCEF